MKWINQPRKTIIRDLIINFLDNNHSATIEDMSDKFQIHSLEKPIPANDINQQIQQLEKKGKVKSYIVIKDAKHYNKRKQIYYIRTQSKYTSHLEN